MKSVMLAGSSIIDIINWNCHRAVFIVLTVFVGLLPVWLNFSDNSLLIEDGDFFDYIIVGAGTAGSILASRLAAEKDLKILLIEAGLAKPSFLNIPALGPLLQLSPFDWQYKTVPQSNCCFALKENRSRWPAGKLVGGSTHLNYMLYVPGHIKDFRSWKNLESNDWDENEILYYFRRSLSGAMPVRRHSYSTFLSEAILEAAKEVGLTTGDVGLGDDSGFTIPHVYQDSWGRRWTADRYLITAAKLHSNVAVKTGTTVRRVLINKKNEAYGVELSQGGKLVTVQARHEVLIAAGTVGSPHILMLSGIGPKNVLQASNVTVKVELPVGRNLQDHVTTGLDLLFSNKPVFSMGDLTSLKAVFQYFTYGSGPFTSVVCETVGMLNETGGSPRALQLMVMMAGVSSDGGLFSRHSIGLDEKVWKFYFAPLMGRNVVTILPVLLHPKSIGDIQLDPSSPYGSPLINPRYLSQTEDVETLVEGLRWVYKLATTTAMRLAGFRINRRPFPGCHNYVFGQADYWRCYVRQLTLTGYHPVGTCKMGLKADSAVVDHKLRVYGVQKLRVVDASIMPTLPSGNTNAATVMIAEKASDLIIQEYRLQIQPCDIRAIFLPPRVC